MSTVIEKGTKPTWFFECPLCGQKEQTDSPEDLISVGEVAMPGSYTYRVYQATKACGCCNMVIYSNPIKFKKSDAAGVSAFT